MPEPGAGRLTGWMVTPEGRPATLTVTAEFKVALPATVAVMDPVVPATRVRRLVLTVIEKLAGGRVMTTVMGTLRTTPRSVALRVSP